MAALTEEQAALIRDVNYAVVGTLNADGSPQLSVVWVDWDGEKVVLNTTEERVKGRNLRRDPRITILVADRNDPYRWVSVHGRAELSTDGAVEHMHAISRKYTGKDFEIAPGTTRVKVSVTPERVSSYGLDD